MLPPATASDEDTKETGDISLPDDSLDATKDSTGSEDKKETKKEEDAEMKDMTPDEKKEEKSETPADEKEEEDEELDLGQLLDQLSDNEDSLKKSDDALANIEKDGTASKEDVATLKEELARMAESNKAIEAQLRKTMGEKSDLIFKNAELEAFGGDSTNPQMLMLSRNMEKATNGDDRAKSKCVTILKDMLGNLTGEDYDSKSTEKKADILSAAESYNNAANPNIKSKKDADDNTLVM